MMTRALHSDRIETLQLEFSFEATPPLRLDFFMRQRVPI